MRKWMWEELFKQTKKMVDRLLKENPKMNDLLGLDLKSLVNDMINKTERNKEIRIEIEQKCAEIAVLVKEYTQNCYPMNPDVIGCYTAIGILCSYLCREFPEDVVAMALARVVEDYVKIRWGEGAE